MIMTSEKNVTDSLCYFSQNYSQIVTIQCLSNKFEFSSTNVNPADPPLLANVHGDSTAQINK